jgi:hypothetical protein
MPEPTEKEKKHLLFLMKTENKQKLNTLLYFYEVYKHLVFHYLDYPNSSYIKNLNIVYLQKLLPRIKNLIIDLGLDSENTFDLPNDYRLFSSLLVINEELVRGNKEVADVQRELWFVYGKIKEFAEYCKAVSEDPTDEDQEILEGIRSLINTSVFAQKGKNLKRLTITEDVVIGPLKYGTDGSIHYKQNLIKLRPQIKDLLVLFMAYHKQVLDYCDIKDELISAKKRSTIKPDTINKYVSELHEILQECFGKKVIFNNEKEGYIFDIKRDS